MPVAKPLVLALLAPAALMAPTKAASEKKLLGFTAVGRRCPNAPHAPPAVIPTYPPAQLDGAGAEGAMVSTSAAVAGPANSAIEATPASRRPLIMPIPKETPRCIHRWLAEEAALGCAAWGTLGSKISKRHDVTGFHPGVRERVRSDGRTLLFHPPRSCYPVRDHRGGLVPRPRDIRKRAHSQREALHTVRHGEVDRADRSP